MGSTAGGEEGKITPCDALVQWVELHNHREAGWGGTACEQGLVAMLLITPL